MMAINGKFPGAGYTDNKTGEPAGALAANLGRMPNLECNQGGVGQSTAINFFVASTNNLMGDNVFEAAKILELSEHIGEIKKCWYDIVPYGSEASTEQLDKFFTAGGTDSDGVAGSRGDRFGKWFVGRIEASLTGTGFAVGNRLSLADVLIYNCFAETMTEAENAEKTAAQREPFTSAARTNELIAKSPKILASIAAVKANENVQKWLATRGPQYF